MQGDDLLRSVRELSDALVMTTDYEGSIQQVLGIGVKAVDASGGTVYLHDPERKELYFFYSVGADLDPKQSEVIFALKGEKIKDDQGVAGAVFQSREPQITNTVESETARQIDELLQQETRNMVTVPLGHPGRAPFGVLQAVNKRSGDFTENDVVALVVLAHLLAAALRVRHTEPRVLNELDSSDGVDFPRIGEAPGP
jgi:signal transduction protein with GAF and PtsI domain